MTDVAERDRAECVIGRMPGGPCTGVEVGVHRGKMSARLLHGNPDLRLVMVDHWLRVDPDGSPMSERSQSRRDRDMRDAIEAVKPFGDRSIVIRATSEAAAAMLLGPFGFVFIDGMHDLDSVYRDCEMWWPLVGSGGLLCGHDYGNPDPWTEGVKAAVDEFSAGIGRPVETDDDHTWFIEKP